MDSGCNEGTDALNAEVQSLARDLLAENREEIARADAKTATLLAAVTVVVGVLLAGMTAGDWSPSKLKGFAAPLWWIGATIALVGIVLLVLAVWPRTVKRRDSQMRACYFGDLRDCQHEQDLLAALRRECEGGSDRVLDQILATSKIVRKKYALIRWGLGTIGAASALEIVAVVTG